MAKEIYQFAVLTPAGTAKADPITTKLTIPARVVQEIQVKVPPGPRGELGWQIAFSSVPVIPKGAGTFIVTDNEDISWVVEDMPDQGDWQVISYNTGHFDHTIYVRFLVTTTAGQTAQAQAQAPLPTTAISPGIPAPPAPAPSVPPPAPPLPPVKPPAPSVPAVPALPGG